MKQKGKMNLKHLFRRLFGLCPECGGRLEEVPGWRRDTCTKCGQEYRWNL